MQGWGWLIEYPKCARLQPDPTPDIDSDPTFGFGSDPPPDIVSGPTPGIGSDMRPLTQALIDRVALEPGFPEAELKWGLYGPSGLGRTCGSRGYKQGGTKIVLTSLAATSAATNRAFTRQFEDFAPLLEGSRGNGEVRPLESNLWSLVSQN